MSEEAPQSLPAVLSDPDSPPPPPDGKKKVIHAQRPNNFYWSLKVCRDPTLPITRSLYVRLNGVEPWQEDICPISNRAR